MPRRPKKQQQQEQAAEEPPGELATIVDDEDQEIHVEIEADDDVGESQTIFIDPSSIENATSGQNYRRKFGNLLL